ncbi:MAG: AEC family transporter [Rhizobiaceae bacterium]
MQIFSLIFPIFAIIVTGFAFAQFKILPEEIAGALIQFVFYVGIPAMLFVAIAQQDTEQLLNWPFIATFGGAVAIVFLAIMIGARMFAGVDLGAATMIAMISVASNTGIIGLPLLHSLFGHKAVVLAALANIIVVAFLLIQIVLLEASAEEEGKKGLKLSHLKSAVMNPVVLSTLVALAYAISPLGVPSIVVNFLDTLGASVAPCALFAVGMSIKPASLIKSGPVILFASSIKLFGLALLVLIICRIFELSPLVSVVAVISAALPTAKTEFVFAKQYHEEEEIVAETVSFTTALSVITLLIWLIVLSHMYSGLFSA